MSCALDRNSQLALMTGAGAGYTAGDNLSAVREISSQAGDVLVINLMNFIYAEGTDFLSAFSAARPSVAIVSFKSHIHSTPLLLVLQHVQLKRKIIVIVDHLEIPGGAAGVRNALILICGGHSTGRAARGVL